MKPGPWAAAAILAAAVLLSHLPLLDAGYVQDDHVAIEGNPIVAEGDAAAIAGASYWEGAKGGDRTLYRPATVASYAAERALVGRASPTASHAINVLLHAAVCWLLFAIAVRAGVEPVAALLGALLFAVTPSKSEAVANVVGRAEVLAALFTLGAVWLASHAGRRSAAWAAAGCVLLACCSKETGVVALPLVAIAALSVKKPRAIDACGMIAPSVLAFVVFAVARTRALEAFFPPQTVPWTDNPLVAEHGVRYAATAIGLISRAARVVVFPVGLANDYSCASIPIETSLLALRPLAGLAIGGGFVVLATRGRPWALFVAIALLPYLVTSNLLVPVGAIFAERFLYLPVAGISLLAAALVERLPAPARVAALALVAILGLAMFARARDWKDDATIFGATARNNPMSPRAFLWLGKPKDAIRCCPESAAAWHDEGVTLARRGDYPGAERALREAIRLEPTRTAPHMNLALVLHKSQRLDEADREARKVTLLNPDNARAFAELGHIRAAAGRPKDAADAYRRAIALGRKDLEPRLRALEAAPTPAP